MTSAQLWDSVVTLYQGDPDKWQPKDRKQDYIDLFTGLQSMSVDDDAIGKINFTPKSLYTKTFVSKLLKRSYEYYSDNCVHNYTNAYFKFCQKSVDYAL